MVVTNTESAMDTEMELEAYSDLSPIQKFFYGRNVFITGASGLVGKVLIEKLLRCCPGIGILFVMMRPKKGKSIDERTDAIFNSMLFKEVKKVFPGYMKHIRIVDGDLEKEMLGISDTDLNIMRDKVSLVFHAAARVKFNDRLKVAVQSNIIATLNLLALCKQMPLLEAVAHVSTSYVRKAPGGIIRESIFRIEITPDQLLSALEWVNEATELEMEKMLLEKNYNTYLLTKSLTEIVVEDTHGDIPTAIIRPCTVGSTWKEPFCGWMDAFQSISGLFLAASKGVLRCICVIPNLKLEIIPLDVVVNNIVVAAYHTAINKPSEVFVLNCTTDLDKVPAADEHMLKKVMEKRTVYPLAKFFRYPDFTLHYNMTTYYIQSFFDQWIPAVIGDAFLYLFTGRTILCSVHRKINFLYGMLLRGLVEGWLFERENYKVLEKNLTEKDKEMFFLTADDMDWDHYMDCSLQIGRQILGREDPSNIPYARRKAYIWWLVTTILKWCIIIYVIYCLIPQSVLDKFSNTAEERFYSLNS